MSFYTSLTGLKNAQTDLGVISHNIANAETAGFKKNARIALESQAGVNLDEEAANLVRFKQVIEADEQIFHAVKQVVIASLHGYPQPLVVESARSGLGHANRPGLSELLDSLRGR